MPSATKFAIISQSATILQYFPRLLTLTALRSSSTSSEARSEKGESGSRSREELARENRVLRVVGFVQHAASFIPSASGWSQQFSAFQFVQLLDDTTLN